MTSKGTRRPPIWRAPFLRALARGGTVRRAAEAAGVDFTTAYARRAGDVGFAAAWMRALEKGKARMAGVGAGKQMRVSAKGKAQVVRAGSGRWSDAAEAAFLGALCERANVRWACAQAGFSTQAVYARRRRDPAFAAKWEHAVAEARVRLDMLLIDTVEVALDPALADMPEAEAREPVSVDQAIAIVRLLDAREAGKLSGRGRWRGKAPVESPIEEARAAILARIAAIERFERGQAGA